MESNLRSTNFLALSVLGAALTLGSVAHAERVHVVIGAGVPVAPYVAAPVYPAYQTYAAPVIVAPAAPYGYSTAPAYGSYTSTWAQQPDPVYVQQPEASPWYYCTASKAFYPQVRACPGGWQQVPARPAG